MNQRPGARRFAIALFVAALLVCAGAAAAAERGVPVHVVTAVPEFEPGPVEIVATPVAVPPGRAVEVARVPLASPGEPAELPLAGDVVWRLEVRGEGIWAAPQVVATGAREEAIALAVYPLGSVSARLEGAAGELPGELTGQVAGAPGRSGPPATPVVCRVEVATLRCPVPAVPIDLQVRIPGHAGLYLWEIRPEAGEALDLGPQRLVPGASVVGWVESEAGQRLAGVEVALDPDLIGSALSPDLVRRIQDPPRAKTNLRGLFQIAGLEPAFVRLRAGDPTLGRGEVGGLELLAGAETRLAGPITLMRPREVEILVTTPAARGGAPWKIRVNRRDLPGHGTEVAQGPTDAAGRFRAQGLLQGQYYAVAEGPSGEGAGWVGFGVPGPEQVAIEVTLVDIEGSVTLAGEPLAAELWFGGRTGAAQARTSSGEDGRFAGTLPREGLWRLDVIAPAAHVERRMEGIEVRRRVDGRPTELAIELPDTRLSGRVVDQQKTGVPGALVEIVVSEESTAFYSFADDTGRFHLAGLGEGELAVSAAGTLADGRFGKAPPRTVRIREGERESEGLELELRTGRTLRGRVVGTAGEPVAFAWVESYALAGVEFADSFAHEAVSGADGAFELTVPEGADRLHLSYGGGSGTALRTVWFDVRGEEGPTLELERRGGEVRVHLPGVPQPGGPGVEQVFLFQNGVALPPSVLSQWARAHGVALGPSAELAVPQLAPGQYSACLLTGEERLAVDRAPGAFAPGPGCRSGYLDAGGLLELDLR